MIYVNKNKERIIVPRINQTYQNRVIDIIVTNQVTKETRELQLIDESTDKNYYEFGNPLYTDVRGYEGTYDYKIVYDNGSVVLSSGIVVVEPDNVADNTTDVKSYEYYPDKIVQYTPNTEYVPQVESVKEIIENGDYWVKYYDRVIVDVPIPEPEEPEFEIPNVTEINGTVGLLYTYQNQNPITEIPTDMIDSEGNLILPDNYGAYVINKGGILNDSATIVDGQWYYNSVDVEIEDKTKLIYRAKSSTSNYVYLLARGLDNVVTTNPSIPLTRPLTNNAKAAIIEYMKKFDNKIIRWNGVEGYIVGINDVSSTPKIYNYPISEEEYMTSAAGIFRGHTYLRKGGIYQVKLVHFNHYFKSESSITGQYVSGWVLTFDELEDTTKFKQEIENLNNEIDQLETENSELSNEVAEKEAYINTAKGITITSNGVYTPEEGVVGYNEINVEVEGLVTLPNGTKFQNSTFSTIPENLDFSEITNFSGMFRNCQKLTDVPALETSNGTDFGEMFFHCYSLTNVGNLNTSNGNDFSYMFQYCENLTSAPQLDTSNGTDFRYMFTWCDKLTTIPQLDVSKGTKFNSMFGMCGELTNITFVGSINYNIDFSSDSPKLTYDSIKSILTACASTINTSSKTLKFKRTIADPNGELAALIGDCTTKGWTITGLTLE